MESIEQHEDQAWADAVLEDALDPGSPILRVFRTGGCPAVTAVADALSVNNHPDREIMLLSAVYLELCSSMVILNSETGVRRAGVRPATVIGCRELGRLGSRLIESRPRTIRGARALVRLADRIMEAREAGSQLAIAQGPAEEFLKLALGCLDSHVLAKTIGERKEQ